MGKINSGFIMLKKLSFIICLVFLAGQVFAAEADKKSPAAPEPKLLTVEQLMTVLPDDVVLGDDKAPVTIIEYSSMTCSHCAAFHNTTFPEIKEKYIDTGKVKFIMRGFPLDEPALRGFMMAKCAAKDSKEKYLKFITVMFSTQSNWAPKKNYLEVLSNIGKLGGMKGEEFDACMADKKLETSILEGKFNASKQLDIKATPTFYVNKEVHRGAQDFKYFSAVIDGILAGGNKDAVKK
jgi:protein-disulfide isomerase